ncbi:ABC transporter ATP-binding protein [Kineobactrum sediminis]|uniref:ABC transporter ATP-binding protein n=1 Tax=Kineobactrum sediminis TaxID=1905677 RepID=A0A2N5Y5G9_9GAMM|nr:AAA family ATPase [Kineobactrum sediminis]PLW83643.1 ABC transporter ATP-binding protein [Kineobactrum sediminis]
MFKVESVEIDGFWRRVDVQCGFNNDVNIIIGRNGSGKTTFMNILHSVLTVDLNGLSENEFNSARVTLIKGKKRKTIKVTKTDDERYPFPVVDYQISRKKHHLRIISSDDRRFSPGMRRRLYEESLEIRKELDSLTSVSSLSVYRLRHDGEYEVRDRHGTRAVSPVDYRLSQALNRLTEFQLDLAEEAQKVSRSLQKDVLASILYGEDDSNEGWILNFDKEQEQTSLVSAYTQLNAMDSDIRRKIRFHVSAIDKSISEIVESKTNDTKSETAIDIKPLEALRKTKRIIDLSLAAKEKNQEIYSQIDLFLKIIKDFISDKEFSFASGRLVIQNDFGEIEHVKLSSGEKQLIILMVEALLQKKEHHIFLADEPELSLHIAWQRKIIPAVKNINPNSQVIVATHSPEVASKYKDNIVDMEKLICG